jgi:small subunit ribosomal protein S8
LVMAKLAIKPTTDPIADLLTRMRNGLMVNKQTVNVPYSKNKEVIVKLLKQYGFVMDYQVLKNGFTQLEIKLASDSTNAKLIGLSRVSKPGRRVYAKSHEIPSIRGGRGLMIVSTSTGVMAGHIARKRGLGGELICKVW